LSGKGETRTAGKNTMVSIDLIIKKESESGRGLNGLGKGKKGKSRRLRWLGGGVLWVLLGRNARISERKSGQTLTAESIPFGKFQ